MVIQFDNIFRIVKVNDAAFTLVSLRVERSNHDFDFTVLIAVCAKYSILRHLQLARALNEIIRCCIGVLVDKKQAAGFSLN